VRAAGEDADEEGVVLLLVLAALALGALLPAGAQAHGGAFHASATAPDEPAHRDAPHEFDGVALARAVQVARAQAGADGDDGLPDSWCGSQTASDRVGTGATRPQIKVVYAHAADRPDRFGRWGDDLQASASLVQRFLSSQTGGRKALRFDVGTSCGERFLDLMAVRLDRSASEYEGDFHAVVSEVWAKLGNPGGPRDLVVLADGLAPGGAYGEAETEPFADQPGASNAHNHGGFASVLWAQEGTEPAGDGWWPEGLLHEITHMLGAVTRFAPHSTPYGHCWDGADLMCYQDGPGARATETICAPDSRAIFQTYDCGRDDYFNPAPPAGSYLATHWNVYDSVFLAACADLAGACGRGSAPTLPPRPPVSTAAPGVLGSPDVGAILAAASGSWINAPQRYGYRWQRERAGNWEDVAGATEPTLLVTPADVGAPLRVLVTAGNDDGEAIAESAPTAPVPAPAPLAPVPALATPAPARVAPAPAQPRGQRVARARLRAGRRTLGWVRFSLAGGALYASPERVSLPAGRYAVRACARPASGAERCAKRVLRVRKRGRVALPILRVAVRAGGPLGATYKLTGPRLAAKGEAASLGP